MINISFYFLKIWPKNQHQMGLRHTVVEVSLFLIIIFMNSFLFNMYLFFSISANND